jgi:cytochrome b6-f complex iron-sulfur subunit
MKAPLPTTRRAVLTGTGAGLLVAVTSACSTGNDYVAPAEGFSVPEASGPATDPDPEDPPNLEGPAEEAPAADANALASLDDIPIGTAKAVKHEGKDLIISHPGKGKVAAFSATCTHQGCPVKPAGQSLDCPCHGAKFDYATGAVTNGPAEKPLAAFAIHMKGRNIMPGTA